MQELKFCYLSIMFGIIQEAALNSHKADCSTSLGCVCLMHLKHSTLVHPKNVTAWWHSQGNSQMPSRMVQCRAALHTQEGKSICEGAGRWFLFHIICIQEVLMLVTAGALSPLERPTLRQLCHQQWLLSYYHDKGSPFCCWQMRFSHCSMLWHHPACSSLTIHGRLDRRFLQAYPDYNNFIWCKRLIQKWRTETAACSHTPELSHLLFWMRQQIYTLSLPANGIPGTGFKFPSFRSHRAWNDHQASLFTNAVLEWRFLEGIH